LLFSKKKAPQSQEPMDLDAVMKKFDRESNTRIWEGKAKIVINCILAAFSLFCVYVTFFATWLDAIRLSSFMGCIVFIGYTVIFDEYILNFVPKGHHNSTLLTPHS